MRHRVRLHDPIRPVVVGVDPVSGDAAGAALQARMDRWRGSNGTFDVGTGRRPPTDRVDHRTADAAQNQRSPVPRKPPDVSGVGERPVYARRIRDEQVLARDQRKWRREYGLPRRRGPRRRHVVQLASAQIGRHRSRVVDLHIFVRRRGSARHHLRDDQLARRRPRLRRDGIAGQDRCRQNSHRDQERNEGDGDPARRRHSGTSGRLPGGVGAPVLRPAAHLRLHCRLSGGCAPIRPPFAPTTPPCGLQGSRACGRERHGLPFRPRRPPPRPTPDLPIRTDPRRDRGPRQENRSI